MTSTRPQRMEALQGQRSPLSGGGRVLQPSYSYTPLQTTIPLPYDPMFLQPSVSGHGGRSPLKVTRQASTSPPQAKFGKTMNSVSFPPPQSSIFTDSPMKHELPNDPSCLAHDPCEAPSRTRPSADSTEKEDIPPVYHTDNLAEFPDPASAYKVPLKRSASFVTALEVPLPKKKCMEDYASPELPQLDSIPLMPDDGRKPPYSYAVLIGMAILRSPDRRLTLSQIYKWITNTFAHYRDKVDSGWQNSIRHNLSLNKAFYKQERPKDDPGKGNYWAIEPGKENGFINKDKSSSRRPASSSGQSSKYSAQIASSDGNIWIPQPAPPAGPSTQAVQTSEAAEPSSDATLIASDAPSSPDEEIQHGPDVQPFVFHGLPSPSPPVIKSSPPMIPQLKSSESTPSPGCDFDYECPMPRPGLGMNKVPELDDSGYFSSLGSSATKPSANPVLPKFNQGTSRIKRGRAEEEIARIRSSSRDLSPTKSRPLQHPTSASISSSPERQLDTTLMLPPLTPAFKFKVPPKPPSSISPNTNLRNHRNQIRELVGSPLKHAGLAEALAFSPAFNIVDEERLTSNCDSSPGFSIFETQNDDLFRRSATCSPDKQPHSHTGIHCVSRSSNILADVTGASINSRKRRSSLRSPVYDSPSKSRSSNKSPLRFGSTIEEVADEDLFGLASLDDEDADDPSGVDILQGFQKIGGKFTALQQLNRPPLGGRSRTSRF